MAKKCTWKELERYARGDQEVVLSKSSRDYKVDAFRIGTYDGQHCFKFKTKELAEDKFDQLVGLVMNGELL